MSLLAQSFEIKDVFYGDNPIKEIDSPYDFISSILPNIYIISGILLLIYLVFGGFMIISSAGNPDDASKGKQVVTNAIMGFIIIFASYWIIQIIEIITGIQILSFS
jgi:hypothetical protein